MQRLARAHPEVCPVKPKVSEGDEINFKDVDLFSPTGALLVKRLNFTVSRKYELALQIFLETYLIFPPEQHQRAGEWP